MISLHPSVLRALGVLAILIVPAVSMAQDPVDLTREAVDPCEEGPTLYRAGEFSEARLLFLACLEQGESRVEILLPLVVMGVREGRLAEATEFGSRAVEVAPDDPEARYWYGRALLRENRAEEARYQWEQGLQLDLGHMGILEGLARLAMAEGETAKAYQLLTQLQRQGLDEPWLDRLLADIAAGKGLWAQSLAHMERAMAAEGASVPDLLTSAELSILAGRKPMAVTYCRQAVDMEPGPLTYGGLGEAYFATDQLDSAIVYLRLAVEQDPSNGRFRFNLANSLEIAGYYEEAETHFTAYLVQVPNDPVGHFNYGIHLDKAGRHAEGMLEVSRAIELDPNMLTARVVLIQMLENDGQYEDALAEVAALRLMDPANANELDQWAARIATARDAAGGAGIEGRIHLLHMILSTPEERDQVVLELEAGEEFTALAVRFSRGSAASKGGDIGWIDPNDMVEPMRTVILGLEPNEISPPLEAGGLFHLFKRVP